MAQIGVGIGQFNIARSSGGSPVFSTLTHSIDPNEIGLGAGLRRWATTGLFNSDFAEPPSPTGGGVTGSALPYWDWNIVSGSSVFAEIIVDPTNGSGYSLVLSLAAGAAGDDACLEQIVPIPSSANRAFSFSPYAFAMQLFGSTDAELYVKLQFYTRGLVATGSESSGVIATSSISGSGTEIGLIGSIARIPPADAYWAAVRYGLRRKSGGSTSATASVKITETYSIVGVPRLHLPDITAPDTYSITSIRQQNGRLLVLADSDAKAGTTDENAHVALFDRVVLANNGAQTLVAGTTINPWGELIQVNAASPITLTSTPTIDNGADGQRIIVMNDGSNAITFQDQATLGSSNLRLSTTTFAMGLRDSLTLVFFNNDWVEVARTNAL